MIVKAWVLGSGRTRLESRNIATTIKQDILGDCFVGKGIESLNVLIILEIEDVFRKKYKIDFLSLPILICSMTRLLSLGSVILK